MTGMDEHLIRIGHVLAPFGVNGAVKLFVIGSAEQLAGVPRLHVESSGWLRVRSLEFHSAGIVVSFVGVTGREAAQRLVGRAVHADENDLAPLPDDEFYYHELRGLPVLAPSGDRIGEVEDVMDTGHQDLLIVRHAAGSAMVPLQAPYVELRRDGDSRAASGRAVPTAIVLDAPPGLLGSDEDASGRRCGSPC